MAKVPDDAANEAVCLCAGCPSKPADGLSFYCVRGRSPRAVARSLCACGWCPVWATHGLTGAFFCAEGVEEAESERPVGAEEIT